VSLLVIAPHPDDESIGCGGSIRLHVNNRELVSVLFLTSGEGGLKEIANSEAQAVREAEAMEAAAELGCEIAGFLRLPDYGLAEALNSLSDALLLSLKSLQPTQIYLPHPGEEHPDHAAVLPALSKALRKSAIPEPWLLGYEVWTPLSRYDLITDITEVWPAKMAAIQKYRSQLASFAYDRAIAGLNQYRGALAGHCEYAEVFATLSPNE
jgi:LmbE family N-acetylglucosaminyl deacetylase